jgi:hypothetical protein
MLSDYGRLRIEERNGILTAIFKRKMKYGKLINNNLDIKEVEKGMEIGGKLTEQQLKEQGYKPVCEVEEPEGSEYFVYREYDACFVQEWRMKDEPLQDGDIWTSNSGVDPTFDDIIRLQRDTEFVSMNINSYSLTDNESIMVESMYPEWSPNSVQVKKGEKYRYNDKLYKVVQDHTTQESWSPANLSSLWEEIVESHEGTLMDPIPWNIENDPLWQGMILEIGKVYTQGGILYECTRDSGIKLTHNLAALVGLYVKIVE